jgi:hypothetical protein
MRKCEFVFFCDDGGRRRQTCWNRSPWQVGPTRFSVEIDRTVPYLSIIMNTTILSFWTKIISLYPHDLLEKVLCVTISTYKLISGMIWIWPTYRRRYWRHEYKVMMRTRCIFRPKIRMDETWKLWSTRKIHGVRLKQGRVALIWSFLSCYYRGGGTTGRTKGEGRNMHAGCPGKPCRLHASAANSNARIHLALEVVLVHRTRLKKKETKKKTKPNTLLCCPGPSPTVQGLKGSTRNWGSI